MIPILRALGLRRLAAKPRKPPGRQPNRRRRPIAHPTLDTALSRALNL